MRLGKYLKAAFLNHWNLLAFGGGLVFSFLTGRPDVVAPLVLAGEAAYLGLLGTHPKFQRAIDAQEAKAKRQTRSVTSTQMFERITKALPETSLQRYEALRARCVALREIAVDLRSHGGPGGDMPFEKMQLQGLDRLLWIYLRLLYTEWSLERFLEHTSEEAIQADVARLEKKLATFGDKPSPRRLRAKKAVEDNLETSRGRLENLEKARENHELVQLEIDRLENKIRSLSELAVNRQEPDFISGQVDAVATSMIETEKTMNELQFATGMTPSDEAVPELLTRAVQTEG